MNTRNSSKSGLFLMELILGIMFFSVAAAICVKLFVSSHQLSEKSIYLNYAVTFSQSIAESFYNNHFEELMEGSSFTFSPDDGHEIIAEVSTNSMENGLIQCDIYCHNAYSEEVIYELHLSKLNSGEVSNE